MERHHFQKRGPEFLSCKGVGVMQRRRIDLPALGNGANRQPLFEAQTKQIDATLGFAAKLRRATSLKLGSLRHDRLRPGPLEEARLTEFSGLDIGKRARGPDRLIFKPTRHVTN